MTDKVLTSSDFEAEGNPFGLFACWLEEVVKKEPDIPEAMVLFKRF